MECMTKIGKDNSILAYVFVAYKRILTTALFYKLSYTYFQLMNFTFSWAVLFFLEKPLRIFTMLFFSINELLNTKYVPSSILDITKELFKEWLFSWKWYF